MKIESWSHALWCEASFTRHDVFEIHPCSRVYPFLPLSMHILQSVYPFMMDRCLGCFQLGAMMNKASVNILVQSSILFICLFIFNIYLFIYYFGCARSSLRHAGSSLWHVGSFFFFLVAACGLLVAARGLLSCSTGTLSCSMRAGSSSPARDWTRAPCIGITESYPLDHQGSPHSSTSLLENKSFHCGG